MAGGVGHSLDQMFNGHGYRACQNTKDGVSGDLVMPACWPTISFGSNAADRSREGANAPHTKFYNDAAIASKHMVVGSGVNHA